MVCINYMPFWMVFGGIMYSYKTGLKYVHQAHYIREASAGGVLRGLGFKLHALICQKESMSVSFVLKWAKNVYTL